MSTAPVSLHRDGVAVDSMTITRDDILARLIDAAERIHRQASRSAKWVASDALRELRAIQAEAACGDDGKREGGSRT